MGESGDKLKWRIKLEEDYVVLCRFCFKKHFEPNKTKNQIYLKDKCFHCGKNANKK